MSYDKYQKSLSLCLSLSLSLSRARTDSQARPWRWCISVSSTGLSTGLSAFYLNQLSLTFCATTPRLASKQKDRLSYSCGETRFPLKFSSTYVQNDLKDPRPVSRRLRAKTHNACHSSCQPASSSSCSRLAPAPATRHRERKPRARYRQRNRDKDTHTETDRQTDTHTHTYTHTHNMSHQT